ncbi:hypothetical protein Fmac_014608 [Flemingia macrophylla]|uniref:non-specific serine/threonine protein kinase n=1 Tax=Flemingia macrophylla TaxID=520843 RepID=A0ABD1ME67_9FABA
MANQMETNEIVGSIDVISYSERVDSLIKSETASFFGDSPPYTFASLVNSAIRRLVMKQIMSHTIQHPPVSLLILNQVMKRMIKPLPDILIRPFQGSTENRCCGKPHSTLDLFTRLSFSVTIKVKQIEVLHIQRAKNCYMKEVPDRVYEVELDQTFFCPKLMQLRAPDPLFVAIVFQCQIVSCVVALFMELWINHFFLLLSASGTSKTIPSSLSFPSYSEESNASSLPTPWSEGEILSLPNLKAFTWNELKNATGNFRPDSFLGEGEFGFVYRGWIDEHTFTASKPGSGMVVAVKRLWPGNFQGYKECNEILINFQAGVNYLGQLHHPNLFKLIGYCLDVENRLLVYEFMPKGSLENYLFRRVSQPLSWLLRMKVAIGFARGLSFLHDAKSQVIHRNFKASKILLDAEFNAKLYDFGLGRGGPTSDRIHVSTRGYASPEYVATGRLTTKSDVYSFRVMLLELLSGRRTVDKTIGGMEQNLVDWAKPYLSDARRLIWIMDSKSEGQYPKKGAFMTVTLVLQCLNRINREPMLWKTTLHSRFVHAFDLLGDNQSKGISKTTPSSLSFPSHSEESNASSLPTPSSEGEILSFPNLKAFTWNELKNATRNFRPDSFLGEGEFGFVYRGWIDEHTFTASKPGLGMVVAVKRLRPGNFQGYKEWLAGVNYLGQLRHPNLIKLLGYCLDVENQLLVYEFMPKGSLENYLFRSGSQPLSWSMRMKVAVGAAKGLSFLHNAKSLIHRNFKASKILLDAEFNAKLCDFGLAKGVPTGDRTHVSTRVMGTRGYAAPEYVATGCLTTKSDVYSFGVVLLELLSGRRTMDKTIGGMEQNLVDWAKPYLSDKRRLFRIMDSKLEGQYPQKGAFMAATLALQCLNSEAKARPQMTEVLVTLQQIEVLKTAGRHSH